MSDGDWHWLAGIFEGEGYAGICNPKNTSKPGARRHVLNVNISQRETTMLEEVKRIAGFGGIYDAHRQDGKPLFIWYCKCAKAREFLTRLLPFIRSAHKRAQVEGALLADAKAREEGMKIMRETLAKCSSERWRRHRERQAA